MRRGSSPIRLLAGASASATFALLAGCVSPSVAVRGASVADRGPEASRVTMDLELTNPSEESIRLLQWEYRFQSGDQSYVGLWEALVTLPPKSTTLTQVPVVLPNAAAEEVVAGRWSSSGSVLFRSPSRLAEIFYDVGLYQPRASFQGSAAEVAARAAAPAVPAAVVPDAAAADSAVR